VGQHGPTIKDAYKKHFLIGTAGDLPGNYSDQEIDLAKENFNIVTPENCMKPALVHPGENTWRFDRPDALVKWCADNNIAIHGHTLVWHAQTNNWFFRDGDKATVTQRLKDHISTLVGRYKGENPELGRRQRSDQRRRQRPGGPDREPPRFLVAEGPGAGIPDACVQVRS